MVMQVVMVMVYYHQPNLKANKSREVLNLSSGCVENTRDSKESLAPGTFSGNVNNWVRLIPSNLSAFVGDHIVQAKAPQQQWGICKGLGHLMLCIFVHSIHPAHVYFDVVKVSNGSFKISRANPLHHSSYLYPNNFIYKHSRVKYGQMTPN